METDNYDRLLKIVSRAVWEFVEQTEVFGAWGGEPEAELTWGGVHKGRRRKAHKQPYGGRTEGPEDRETGPERSRSVRYSDDIKVKRFQVRQDLISCLFLFVLFRSVFSCFVIFQKQWEDSEATSKVEAWLHLHFETPGCIAQQVLLSLSVQHFPPALWLSCHLTILTKSWCSSCPKIQLLEQPALVHEFEFVNSAESLHSSKIH